MEHKLKRENQQLKQENTQLRINLAHWQLRAILGDADYERMLAAEDEYKELLEIVSEGLALNDLSSKNVDVIDSAITVLNEADYF